MPYEYEIKEMAVDPASEEDTIRAETVEWLNKLGQENWRLIKFYDDYYALGLFERKIEINPKLRNMQIKVNPKEEILNSEKGSVE